MNIWIMRVQICIKMAKIVVNHPNQQNIMKILMAVKSQLIQILGTTKIILKHQFKINKV